MLGAELVLSIFSLSAVALPASSRLAVLVMRMFTKRIKRDESFVILMLFVPLLYHVCWPCLAWLSSLSLAGLSLDFPIQKFSTITTNRGNQINDNEHSLIQVRETFAINNYFKERFLYRLLKLRKNKVKTQVFSNNGIPFEFFYKRENNDNSQRHFYVRQAR